MFLFYSIDPLLKSSLIHQILPEFDVHVYDSFLSSKQINSP